MNGLTGFQRDVLYVIAELDEPSGSEIKDHLEEYYGNPVDRGQLYPNIDLIAEVELINKHRKNEQRNSHTLNAKGYHEIKARQEWEDERLSFDI
ncbi:helix-turn-helix transcriptional regulator [Halalkalicoccus salilacus]|uniref:helix-turn-helix transcriptional regulator n=1 Tax=Halalkalicoccus TaxID=332246 RepID=UPI002F960F6D